MADNQADGGAGGAGGGGGSGGGGRDRLARQRLARALRHLASASLWSDADVAVLDRVTGEVEGIAAGLTATTLQDPWSTQAVAVPPGNAEDPDWMMPLNAVSGILNPTAPPVRFEILDGVVRGSAVLGLPYVGPPGTVHGGWVSAMLDDALGLACVAGGHPGFTASLTVDFRRPTPLHADLVLEARLTGVEGRKGQARGTITVDGEVTAEATGLFIRPGWLPAA